MSERRNLQQPPALLNQKLDFTQEAQERPTPVTANKCLHNKALCLPGMRTAVIGVCKVKKKKKIQKLNSEAFLALSESTRDFHNTQMIRLSLTPAGGA